MKNDTFFLKVRFVGDKNVEDFKSGIYKLKENNSDKIYEISVYFCSIETEADYKNYEKFLTKSENYYYNSLHHVERKKSFLLGRYAAKNAVKLLTKEDIRSISIKHGIFNYPIVKSNLYKGVNVAISHCENIGVAIAYPEELLIGIDIEKVTDDIKKLLIDHLTLEERKILEVESKNKDILATLMWTSKEALSKILKTGFTVPLSILEIQSIKFLGDRIVNTYKNFNQYETVSFQYKNYLYSITIPKDLSFVNE